MMERCERRPWNRTSAAASSGLTGRIIAMDRSPSSKSSPTAAVLTVAIGLTVTGCRASGRGNGPNRGIIYLRRPAKGTLCPGSWDLCPYPPSQQMHDDGPHDDDEERVAGTNEPRDS